MESFILSLFFLFLFVFVAAAIVGFVLWFVALVDVCQRRDEEWQAIGSSRGVWIAILAVSFLFLPAIGGILYWFVPRKAFKALPSRMGGWAPQSYGAQSYGAQPYGAQPYGGQPGWAPQPYAAPAPQGWAPPAPAPEPGPPFTKETGQQER